MNNELKIKRCKDCGEMKPETREYYGQYKNKRNGITKIGFRNSCRTCMAKNTAQYAKNNPDRGRIRKARRIQQETKAQGSFTNYEIAMLRKRLNDLCRFCEKPLEGKGEIEHLTPISRGGSNNIKNLTLACLSCNREKTNKTMSEYMDWRSERNLYVRKIDIDFEAPDTPTISEGRRSY